MGELLPTITARTVRDGIVEYLDTTFALAEPQARAALREFIEDPAGGIFKGPFVRTRLPFRPAADGWRGALDWHPLDDGKGFPPYGHQAAAFRRLSSLAVPGEPAGPQPTLVTTGTGSGKTEAFLYPILDHARRERARGVSGTKALLLYPMNALAHDQAGRIKDLITNHPALAGVTAGIYTGVAGPERTVVSEHGLITSRDVLRSNPPDLLLTNYKMLDQLLLRRADARIWERSAHALRYLVLDEFHTYDGAQGTDVAMLLRRLGLTLRAHGASGDGPLAGVVPVATSATLGDQGDPATMLAFAKTVFGVEFPADSVITESRIGLDEWCGAATVAGEAGPSAHGAVPLVGESLVSAVDDAVVALEREEGSGHEHQVSPAERAEAVARAMWSADAVGESIKELARRHPVVEHVLDGTREAVRLRELAALIFPDSAPEPAERTLANIAALLSHLRREHGPSWPSIETHLWVRELTRIDRTVTNAPAFSWGDDGAHARTDGDEAPPARLPALYCRHCGRSGWGITLSPANDVDLDTSDADIRRDRASGGARFRPLIAAAESTLDEEKSGDDGETPTTAVRWLHPIQRRLLHDSPADDDAEAPTAVRVVSHIGPEASDRGRDDTCPACLQRDGIRFLGSAMATQLSVALSTIFGDAGLDAEEKKTLIFTDSVQDAAHRAGFVQARSRALAMRSMLREAVGDQARSLDELPARILDLAGDDRDRRHRALPPELADRSDFAAFWEKQKPRSVPARIQTLVRKRLAFDAALEFGLQSRLGRTLEVTGTLAAEVDVPRATLLGAARRAAEEGGLSADLMHGAGDERLVGWARGVLEHMRTRGAIGHPWLERLIQEDGKRYWIWRGRPRNEGMPAFPIGRAAPAFPRDGAAPAGTAENVLERINDSRSWYAQWAARSLGIPSSGGGALTRLLLRRLASDGVLQKTTNAASADVYAIPADRVIIEPIDAQALAGGEHRARCSVCAQEEVGTREVMAQLIGAGACLRLGCRGELRAEPGAPGNFYRRFYRSHEAQRVTAREHTSLLRDDERTAYEDGFRNRTGHPGAPNVLVATPTLEMGIDIGDLSAVMLASLPRSVASYLQRVGRAGRITGSALDLAFVAGRRDQLPQLANPLSIINGAVRPPATYVDAEELLRRQFIASLADIEARDSEGQHPERATSAISKAGEGTYLHNLAKRGEDDGAHLERFLASFETLRDSARDDLRAWVRPGDRPLTSAFARRLFDASLRWNAQRDLIGYRVKAIEAVLESLRVQAERPGATDDDRQAHQAALAGLRLARAQRSELDGEHWIGVLERLGVFPNYTLRDDGVTLDVGISWMDPNTGEYEREPFALSRSATLGLRDFAPGATFYARGLELKVSAVDLGKDGEAVRTFALCAACGYEAELSEGAAPPASCLRCGSPTIADTSQRLPIVELTRVSSSMRRDEATIDDSREDREREQFVLMASADYEPTEVRERWFVEGTGFGAKHVKRMTVRWLNLGKKSGKGSTRTIAGLEMPAELFRVCTKCGHLDSQANSNNRYDHRPWCPNREAEQESSVQIALSHHLVTEGLYLRLPPMVGLGSSFALPSLQAAVLLGLREHLGGAPDHIALSLVTDPDGSGADPVESLLLHDTVPGGTGYLADIGTKETMRSVLERALQRVETCECIGSDRIACHHCLLPFAPWGREDSVSRAEAARQLRDLLASGRGEDFEPGDELPEWSYSEAPPVADDPESHLERLFREVFRDRLTTAGVTIKAFPSAAGDVWELTAPGGRRWTLEPQVLVAGCKPDFVLRTGDRSLPPIAIFCDGQRFHVSAQHRRVDDDALKRATLRDAGYAVVAVAHNDLDKDADADPRLRQWFDAEQAAPLLEESQLGLRATHFQIATSGPLQLLVNWVLKPEPVDLQTLGRALPFLLMTRARWTGTLGSDLDLEATAATVATLGEIAAAPGVAHGWAWWSSSVAVVARGQLGTAWGTDVALVLNDSLDAIDRDIRDDWRTWLWLSTLLGFRDAGTAITVSSLVGARESAGSVQVAAPSAAGAPSYETSEPGEADLPAAWRIVLGDALDGERALIAELAGRAVAVPEYGPEVDGIPLGLTWPAARVTVDTADLTGDEREQLETLGWRIVEASADAIEAALEGAT